MATIPSLVPPAAAYLAEVARQGRTTTYGEVARAIGTGPRVAPKVCMVIRDLCVERGWPALTALVVSAATGMPGDVCLGTWLPAETDASAKAALIRAMQAEACAFDWAPLLAYYGVH